MLRAENVALVTGDNESLEVLIQNLKKVIAFVLAAEPELRTRGLKVTSAEEIVSHINAQLTKLIFDEIDGNSIIIKYEWFSVFSTSDDAFQTYEYGKLSFPTAMKMTSLSQIEATFFDWRYHFQMEASSTTNDEKFSIHVVFNESNVLDCFFDQKVDKNVFGHDQFSPMYRYLESRMQNNECPVESIISMFEKQTFRNQDEDTAENRAIIKINGDSISGAEDFCDILAEMTSSGNETWGIQKLTLPITYGRYHSELAKAFAREYAKQGQKFDYLYKCKSDSFQEQMRSIASNYEEVNFQLMDDDE